MNEIISTDWSDVGPKLSDPFAPNEISWKPGATSPDKTQTMALAFLNARAVMDRLDTVVGQGNWNDSYRILPDGKHVECTLTIFGVSKSDVGEPPGSDFADKMKGAYSDALKRAAVKFGVGRYLYRLESQWVSYDEQRKRLAEVPRLPAWALPEGIAEVVSNKETKLASVASNGENNGKKLMAPVKFVHYVVGKLGYDNDSHVRATMGLLGFKTVPQDKSRRKLMYDALEAYRGLRNKGVPKDDALAALDGEKE